MSGSSPTIVDSPSPPSSVLTSLSHHKQQLWVHVWISVLSMDAFSDCLPLGMFPASIRAVSRQLNLSWSAIDRIMARTVARGLSERHGMDVERLAVNEASFRKGHEYITIISNAHGHVLAVEDGKSSESLGRFYEGLSVQQRDNIQSISMDMGYAYQKVHIALHT